MPTLDTVTVPKIKAVNLSGPSSYTTGGFTADFSADFSFVRSVRLVIETRGNLVSDMYEVTAYNQDNTGAFAQGKCVIKLNKDMYDKMTMGNVSSQPGGVTVQASKTSTGTTSGSSHTHAIDHNHPSVESGAVATAQLANWNTAVGGGPLAAHTHTFDLDNFTGSSGANTHTHARSFEYAHTHPITQAETNVTITEVANATNLSTTVWRALVIGD